MSSAADRQCRYCLAYGNEEGLAGPEGELVAPCGCTGGQQWVHLGCLRRWQRSVLVTQPTHPALYADDVRTTHCGVCTQRFRYQPPSRHELMAGFTGAELASLVEERSLICASETFSAAARVHIRLSASRRNVLNFVYWCQGVYLIYYAGSRQVALSIPDEENRAAVLDALDASGRLAVSGRRYRLASSDRPAAGDRQRAANSTAASGGDGRGAGGDRAPAASPTEAGLAGGAGGLGGGEGATPPHASPPLSPESGAGGGSGGWAGDAGGERPAPVAGDGGAGGAAATHAAEGGSQQPGSGPGPPTESTRLGAEWVLSAMRGAGGGRPGAPGGEAAGHDEAAAAAAAIMALRLPAEVTLEADQADPTDTSDDTVRAVNLSNSISHLDLSAEARRSVRLATRAARPGGGRLSNIEIHHHLGGPCGPSRCTVLLPVGDSDGAQFPLPVGFRVLPQLGFAVGTDLSAAVRLLTEVRMLHQPPQAQPPAQPPVHRGRQSRRSRRVRGAQQPGRPPKRARVEAPAPPEVAPAADGVPARTAAPRSPARGPSPGAASPPAAGLPAAPVPSDSGELAAAAGDVQGTPPRALPAARRGGAQHDDRDGSDGAESASLDMRVGSDSDLDAGELAASPPPSSEENTSDDGAAMSSCNEDSSDIEDATIAATAVPVGGAAGSPPWLRAGPSPQAHGGHGDEGPADAPAAARLRPLLVFWGEARWQRAQLLGELARGDWGLCRATAADLTAAPHLWQHVVVRDQRPAYAPRSEMSRHHAFETPIAQALLRRLRAAHLEATRQQEQHVDDPRDAAEGGGVATDPAVE